MRLAAFLIVLTVLRLVMIGQMELSPDEAYYHEWSQRLDWCYFSKGPGVALAMRAGTTLFGHGEFGVRFFAPLLALGTSLLVFWLARRLYDARTATWTVVLLNLTPLFNAGGLLMTIDPLSIFFWIAALCTLWRALEKSSALSLWWPLSGVLIGAGFLCKWTNAFQLLGVLLLLAMTPRYRRELLRPGFWSMVAAFAPALWPPWHWQEPRGWPLLHHLSSRGGLETPWWQFNFTEFGKFFASHFGVYSPLIFAAMLIAFWAACKDSLIRWCVAFMRAIPALPRGLRTHPVVVAIVLFTTLALYFLGNAFELPLLHKLAIATPIFAAIIGIAHCKDEANIHWKSRFLIAFALPVVLTYLWISLHHDSEVNWTAPAAVTIAILTVAHWLDRAPRTLATTAFVLGGALSIIGMNPGIVRAVGIPWPFKYDHTTRLRGWTSTAKTVADFRQQYEKQLGQPVFLIAENYGLAGSLCYSRPEKRIESPGHPACYVEESPVAANQFHFWGRYDEYEERTAPIINDQEDSREYGINKFAGRTALYITTRDEQKPPGVLKRTFEQWELATDFELKENGQPLRTIRIFICHRYKPGQLLD